jgi:hypothetical protein
MHGGDPLRTRRSRRKKKSGFIGNRRDSPEYLAIKRKAKLISPYIWRSATVNSKEPKLVLFVSFVDQKLRLSKYDEKS